MGHGRKHNRTGRSKGLGSFVMFTHEMLDTPAFRSLTAPEKVILLAVTRLYNGHNNGDIGFGARAGEHWGIGRTQTAAALRRLVEIGFLQQTQRSSFDYKRRTATYALTWRVKNVPSTVPATFGYRTAAHSPLARPHSPPGRTETVKIAA